MIIPVYHVIVSQFSIAATTTIEPGMVVGLNSSTGYAEKCVGTVRPIGIAAERARNAEAYEWTNRVSDFGNDTRASRLLSVYHGGGEFYVDVDDAVMTTPNGTAIKGVIKSGATTTPGTPLYVAATGSPAGADDGKLQSTSGSGNGTVVVATVVEGAAALESGIPGEFEPGSSVNYTTDYDTSTGSGARQFVKIKLEI